MRPVNLSIRMVAVRRGRRQEEEEEEEEEQSKVYSSTGESISFFLQSSSVPQKRPQPPPNYTIVGSLTLPLPLLLTGTSAYGTCPTATVLVYHRYLRSRKGVRKGRTPTGQATICHRPGAELDTLVRNV
jgi:hypothetical protein